MWFPARNPRLRFITAAIAVTLAVVGCGQLFEDSPPEGLSMSHPQVQAVVAVQGRHTDDLLQSPGIVGTATGLTRDGELALLILFQSAPSDAVPERIDGVPVRAVVTGKITALHHRPGHGGGPGGGGGGDPPDTEPEPDPTEQWPRPVPIGISTGSSHECSSGTIGARVLNAGGVFALSNNHVYATENSAPIGSDVLQPGSYDTGCAVTAGAVIGSLVDFEPIVFTTDANNQIDAAIASSSVDLLGKATPSDGYGAPLSLTADAAVGISVQKYGRTSSLTRGTITGINAIVNVGYGAGSARFIGQIIVESTKPFIKAGDSGSLLVTDPGRAPVGLLFAGNRSGKFALANPIEAVLTRFGVSIDGE